MAEQPTEPAPAAFETDIAPYRQPMVTSVGIIMGFQLAFLANWSIEADGAPAVSGPVDTVLALTMLASVVLFTAVLVRLLNNRVVVDPAARYQLTLKLYLAALALAIVGLAVALFV